MPTHSSFLRAVLVLVFLGVTVGVGSTLAGVPTESIYSQDRIAADTTVAPDTTSASSFEPYATDRSLAYHVLATPAYVLYGLSRPLGWAVRYVENRFPDLFTGEEPPRGGIPLVEFGGSTGFLGGLLFYDNRLFGTDHGITVRALYGGTETFVGGFRYRMPAPLGNGTALRVRANWLSDPRDTFFRNGNDSRLRQDGRYFGHDQLDVSASLSHAPPDAVMRTEVGLTFQHTNVWEAGKKPNSFDRHTGPTDLLKPHVTLLLDRTRGRPRTHYGTELFLQFEYAHDLTSDRFYFGRYVAELRQYLPVPLLPNSRRLALRGRLEQSHPLFGSDTVPFYQLPHLGGQMNLRGFRYRRFQNEGSLALSAEYRYPIWMNLDAVLFADAGQVFDRAHQIAGDRFHWSYGGGLHLLSRNGLRFRFELAGSSEGVRTLISVQPTFREIPL